MDSKLKLYRWKDALQSREHRNSTNKNWDIIETTVNEQTGVIDMNVRELNGRMDSLVLKTGGDSNPEVQDAKADQYGNTYPLLNSRLNAIDSSIDDLAVNVKRFGAVGDGVTDDTAAIEKAYAFAFARKRGLRFPLGLYKITKTLEFNVTYAYPFSIFMEGAIKPKENIGVSMRIQNVNSGKLNVQIADGGSESDIGLQILGLVKCKLNIVGNRFKGTLFKVDGTVIDGNTNHACIVQSVLSQDCGRALVHGQEDRDKYTDAFGTYVSIWDFASRKASVFQNANDITIQHYENWFNNENEDSLLFQRTRGIHLGIIAIGGRAKALIRTKSVSNFTINKLYTLGEDSHQGYPVKTTNGLVLEEGAQLSLVQYRPADLDTALIYSADSNINILDFLPEKCYRTVISGNSEVNYPIDRKGSFNSHLSYQYGDTDFLGSISSQWYINWKQRNTNKKVKSIYQDDGKFVFYADDKDGNSLPILSYATGGDKLTRFTLASGSFIGASSPYSPATEIPHANSPARHTNNNDFNEQIIVSGGVVAEIQINRQGKYVKTGVTQGAFVLGPYDQLIVSYSSPPILTRFPL
ncbi:glycosyl hydrolase family 28-related protein [Bacillus cereus]|nr:glycosyl hydrolase family 28-related protein [Bacillus cereus]